MPQLLSLLSYVKINEDNTVHYKSDINKKIHFPIYV